MDQQGSGELYAVAPPRGAWIEIAPPPSTWRCAGSLPHGERGLKCRCFQAVAKFSPSLPHGERGLKLPGAVAKGETGESLPHGERGLKLWWQGKHKTICWSRSPTGSVD